MKLVVYALHANTYLHKNLGTILINVAWLINLHKYLNDFGEFYTLIVDLRTLKPLLFLGHLIPCLIYLESICLYKN